MPRIFQQVNVFSVESTLGNPVAVVDRAEALTEERMQAFARWTNLSETTFLLPPTVREADYRLRIFTPGGELPFAGHPTLGSAHAWLVNGGEPRGEHIVQECGVGLVRIRQGERLGFAAPLLTRDEEAEPEAVATAARALLIEEGRVRAARWLTNGPHFLAVLLSSAAEVLAIEPDPAAFDGLDIGVVGMQPAGADTAIEVRVFGAGMAVDEDPVTGSFNAAVAQWLTGDGTLPPSYVAAQGTALGRRGRVHVTTEDGVIWVAGDTVTTIFGEVQL